MDLSTKFADFELQGESKSDIKPNPETDKIFNDLFKDDFESSVNDKQDTKTEADLEENNFNDVQRNNHEESGLDSDTLFKNLFADDFAEEGDKQSEDKNNDAGIEKGNQELTSEEKDLIQKETGWPNVIIDEIISMEQYNIYKNAELHYAEIDGRPCLVKNIDMDYIDSKTGKTNFELMTEGKSPYDSKTGEKIELHHMNQDFNAPFAELCENSDHGGNNYSVLHPNDCESWRQDPEKNNQYNNHQRPDHWQERAKEE